MTVQVSVVIAVWNPGTYLERGVDSLLAQTMPPSDFEVLFMDDGSNDGTETRLDELAEKYPNFHVHHLENSGWPGKPRNLGIERAVGEYVLFMDNDDALGVEALERMYAIGARNSSDIVIGKVISDFRGVPHQVFRTTRERATVHDAPLFDSLTPHKMFRRQFLLDHEIRYPEGKRRLEDQLIMARAYFPAKNVSIVGDYVCYYYLKRDDGKNAGSTRIEPHGYYDNLREVLDVVEANTEPGEFRDRIQRRFYRGEMLGRVGPPSFQTYPAAYRDVLFAEVRRLALDPRFDPAVHAGLPALLRVRSFLLREDRLSDLIVAAERFSEVRAHARLENLRWREGALVLDVRAWFTYRDGPLELIGHDGRLFLAPEVAVAVPAEERECTGQLEDVLADLTIKNRDTADEFFLPAALACREITGARSGQDEVLTVEWRGEACLDPGSAYGGRALPRGVWDVSVKLTGLGLSRTTRLGNDRDPAANRGAHPALLAATRVVIPYWTKPYDNLSVDIDQYTKKLSAAVDPASIPARIIDGSGASRLELTLPMIVDDRDVTARLRLSKRHTGATRDQPMMLRREPDAIVLTADLPARRSGRAEPLRAGTWDIALTSATLGWQAPGRRCGAAVVVPRLGRVRIVMAPDGAGRSSTGHTNGVRELAIQVRRRIGRALRR